MIHALFTTVQWARQANSVCLVAVVGGGLVCAPVATSVDTLVAILKMQYPLIDYFLVK